MKTSWSINIWTFGQYVDPQDSALPLSTTLLNSTWSWSTSRATDFRCIYFYGDFLRFFGKFNFVQGTVRFYSQASHQEIIQTSRSKFPLPPLSSQQSCLLVVGRLFLGCKGFCPVFGRLQRGGNLRWLRVASYSTSLHRVLQEIRSKGPDKILGSKITECPVEIFNIENVVHQLLRHTEIGSPQSYPLDKIRDPIWQGVWIK